MKKYSYSCSVGRVCQFGDVGLVPVRVVFLFVEPSSVAQILVRVVAGELIGRDLLVRVSEANVTHVILVVQKIGVERVVVPEVVLVVFASPMPLDHVVQETRHSEANVGPEDRSEEVEPGVDRSENLVIGVGREFFIGCNIGEEAVEGDKSVLNECD